MFLELLSILSLYVFVELYRSTKEWFCKREPRPQPVLIELLGDHKGSLDDLHIWMQYKKDEEYEQISLEAHSLENALDNLFLLNRINPNRPDVGVYLYLMPEKRFLRYETLDVFTKILDGKEIKKIQDQFERIPFPQDNFVAHNFGKLLSNK